MRRLDVLTWNLMHGRAVPPAGRELLDEFASALASWKWDVALLQEVPPWWPLQLATRLHAEQRHVLTSRNSLLALRRAIATRWPDVIKSNGGGANAILARNLKLGEQQVQRLRLLPERRWVHAVEVEVPAGGVVWVGNLHAAASPLDAELAAAALRAWARSGPALLGGDFNVGDLELAEFARLGGHGVDQVYASEEFATGETEVLDAGALSDHAPVLVRTAGPGRIRSRA